MANTWACRRDSVLGAWHGPRMSTCGTSAGYYRHRRRDEPPCDACRAAKMERVRANRARALASLTRHGYAGSYDAGCRCGECLAYRRRKYAKEAAA
jgi:hypothetical protein